MYVHTSSWVLPCSISCNNFFAAPKCEIAKTAYFLGENALQTKTEHVLCAISKLSTLFLKKEKKNMHHSETNCQAIRKEQAGDHPGTVGCTSNYTHLPCVSE